MQYPWKSKESFRTPEAGVTPGHMLPLGDGSWSQVLSSTSGVLLNPVSSLQSWELYWQVWFLVYVTVWDIIFSWGILQPYTHGCMNKPGKEKGDARIPIILTLFLFHSKNVSCFCDWSQGIFTYITFFCGSSLSEPRALCMLDLHYLWTKIPAVYFDIWFSYKFLLSCPGLTKYGTRFFLFQKTILKILE